jgi:hypothetical protein
VFSKDCKAPPLSLRTHQRTFAFLLVLIRTPMTYPCYSTVSWAYCAVYSEIAGHLLINFLGPFSTNPHKITSRSYILPYENEVCIVHHCSACASGRSSACWPRSCWWTASQDQGACAIPPCLRRVVFLIVFLAHLLLFALLPGRT